MLNRFLSIGLLSLLIHSCGEGNPQIPASMLQEADAPHPVFYKKVSTRVHFFDQKLAGQMDYSKDPKYAEQAFYEKQGSKKVAILLRCQINGACNAIVWRGIDFARRDAKGWMCVDQAGLAAGGEISGSFFAAVGEQDIVYQYQDDKAFFKFTIYSTKKIEATICGNFLPHSNSFPIRR